MSEYLPKEVREGLEMARAQGKCTFQIGNCRPVQTGAAVGHGPHMPALGKFRRMVGQRGQMFDCLARIPGFQRVATSFEQQIHRRRPGMRQFQHDFVTDFNRFFSLGLLQLHKKPVQTRLFHRPGR